MSYQAPCQHTWCYWECRYRQFLEYKTWNEFDQSKTKWSPPVSLPTWKTLIENRTPAYHSSTNADVGRWIPGIGCPPLIASRNGAPGPHPKGIFRKSKNQSTIYLLTVTNTAQGALMIGIHQEHNSSWEICVASRQQNVLWVNVLGTVIFSICVREDWFRDINVGGTEEQRHPYDQSSMTAQEIFHPTLNGERSGVSLKGMLHQGPPFRNENK